MKNALDILFAALAILLLMPVFMIVAITILIVERSKVFFLQERLGKDKKAFTIYKYRTMLNGEITPLGRVLRKTGIDELPQLFNILWGQMSFVGPRPLTESDVKRLEWDTSYYKKRWYLKPGIVGLAQLAPVCHKKVSWLYDQFYIKNQSLFLDLKIIIAAGAIPFVGKNTVKKWIHGNK